MWRWGCLTDLKKNVVGCGGTGGSSGVRLSLLLLLLGQPWWGCAPVGTATRNSDSGEGYTRDRQRGNADTVSGG
ncbi:hypothetical protein ACOMHN_031948 [Nucella lapillus]